MATMTAPPINLDIGLNLLVSSVEDFSIGNKMKRKDDFMGIAYGKILDQSKKRLNSLDAQRIISSVDDSICKCEIVTLLPYISENIGRYSVMLGSDLSDVLKEYDHVQQLYMNALGSVRKTRPSSARSLSSENNEVQQDKDVPMSAEMHTAVENVNRISVNLSHVVKTIVRLFRANPVAMTTLKAERGERSFEANSLIDYLLCLREELYNRLVTTASEEQEKQKMSVNMLKREKKSRAAIKKLETELDKNTKEKRDMITMKNEAIRQLKSTIQTIEQDSDISSRKMVNDARKVEAAEIKNSDVMQSKLQQDIISLKQQMQANTQTHRTDELVMRKRKFKIETEVENWLQKYDSDMTEKQDELDELSAIYREEKSQLEKLEERFDTLEKEYTTIIEERRIAQERKELEETEMKRMIKAATLLQSFWRSYKCRKALKAKQKKGKKGKGKKKKR